MRRTVELLGELLSGAGRTASTASGFLEASLGRPHTSLVSERVDLSHTQSISVGAAVADLVTEHGVRLGPVVDDEAPTWQRIDLDGEHVSVPKSAAAFFPAGSATPADVVVQLVQHDFEPEPASLRVLSRPADHAAALTTRAPLLRDLALGTNRGILLAGPPGVGKSALSRVVARELAGAFTIIVVDAAAASSVLRQVYRETVDLGPSVVILEDIDLYLGDRKAGARGTALADLLAVLDGTEPYTDVLTIASTNNPAALDAAATRSARFDSVLHLQPPDRAACARILARYLQNLGEVAVDCDAVAQRLPAGVTGADLREVVRRAVLSHGRDLTTARLLTVVAEGRWQPAPLTGNYL